MELPVVQYGWHRPAFQVVTVIGLIIAGLSSIGFARHGLSAAFSWVLLAVGLILIIRCGLRLWDSTIVLELNPEGIRYHQHFIPWQQISSYAIREIESESGHFHFLLLRIHGRKSETEIQLDWLNNQETLPDHMAAYATAFGIRFDGTIRK